MAKPPHHSPPSLSLVPGSCLPPRPCPMLSGTAADSMAVPVAASCGGRLPVGVPLLPQQPWAEQGGLSWRPSGLRSAFLPLPPPGFVDADVGFHNQQEEVLMSLM